MKGKKAYVLRIQPTENGLFDPVVVEGQYIRNDGMYTVIKIAENHHVYLTEKCGELLPVVLPPINGYDGWAFNIRRIRRLRRLWIKRQIMVCQDRIAANKQEIAYWRELSRR